MVTILAVGETTSHILRAPSIAALVPGAIAVGVAAVVWVVARRVLTRAQPYLSPDELAADEAIRSRSLHVLCGSGVAITSICLAEQLPASEHQSALLLTLSGVAVGWAIATARFRVDGKPAAVGGMAA
jgi:hypothetical protein